MAKRIVITENRIEVYGFGDTEFLLDDLGSCRDVGRAALAWGAKRISDDQFKDAIGDWDNETTGLGD